MASFNLFTTALVAVPLWLVLVVVYRLTLHPLAKYPGPRLWSISGWPDAAAARSGRRHLIHHQLHCKYGRVVRISPNRLSWDTAQAFHDIHSNRNANVAKSGFVEFTRKITDAMHLQQLPDKREHAQRRKIMAHAFSDGALKSSESFMQTQIRTWMKELSAGADRTADGWSVTRDLGHWTNLLTLDIFGELCFGKDFGASEQGDNEIIHFILKGTTMGHTLAFSPIGFLLVPLLQTQFLLMLLSRRMYEARWALRHRLHDLVTQRQASEIDAEQNNLELRKDFFHHVFKARDDDGNMLDVKEYIAEAVLLIAAGTDTTSTALAAALWYLNRNPDKLAKLRAEVDNAFASVDDIHTGPTLSGLHYTRACIEEAMRMTPPVPGALTRMTLSGGHTIDGAHIPAGIDVEVPMYSLSHNEAYYPDAHSYLPERWIVGSKTPRFEVTEELAAKQRNAFVPFSTGARNCLGMRMAYMEMGIVLARLVYMFDMRFDNAKQPPMREFETEDWFISTKVGPYLQFKPRVRSEKV